MAGAFFETFVVSEIVKNFQAAGINYPHSHYNYRDIDQKEIDLLYVNGGAITPIEIKKGMNPGTAKQELFRPRKIQDDHS